MRCHSQVPRKAILQLSPWVIHTHLGPEASLPGSFFVRPAEHTHSEVKALYTPDKGKVLARGKGAEGE